MLLFYSVIHHVKSCNLISTFDFLRWLYLFWLDFLFFQEHENKINMRIVLPALLLLCIAMILLCLLCCRQPAALDKHKSHWPLVKQGLTDIGQKLFILQINFSFTPWVLFIFIVQVLGQQFFFFYFSSSK